MYTKAQHSFFLWNVCNSLYYRKTLIVLKHPLPPPIFRQKNPENGAYLTCAEIRFRSSVTLKTDKNGRLFRKPFGIPNTELNGVPKNGGFVSSSCIIPMKDSSKIGMNPVLVDPSVFFHFLLKLNDCVVPALLKRRKMVIYMFHKSFRIPKSE